MQPATFRGDIFLMAEGRTDEQLRYVLGLANEWLRFGEAKNGALLGAASAAMFAASRFLPDEPASSWLGWYLLLAIGQCAFAAAFALLAFLPKVKLGPLAEKGDCRDTDSIYHYGDIAKYEPAAYLKRLSSELGEDAEGKAAEDLAGQVVNNSRIAVKKYRCFTVGAWFLVSALLTPLLAGLLLYMGEED